MAFLKSGALDYITVSLN